MIYIILLWVLYQLSAPSWCWLVFSIAVAYKLLMWVLSKAIEKELDL